MAMNPYGPAARAAAIAANAQRLSARLGTLNIGGFTINPNTGEDVSTGYAASDYGAEVTHPGVAKPEQITAYAAANDVALAHPRAHLGGWHPYNSAPANETRQESDLDVSQVYQSRREANARAVRTAQEGIMDLTLTEEVSPSGETVGPYYPTDYPTWTNRDEQRELAQSMHDLEHDVVPGTAHKRRFPGS